MAFALVGTVIEGKPTVNVKGVDDLDHPQSRWQLSLYFLPMLPLSLPPVESFPDAERC